VARPATGRVGAPRGKRCGVHTAQSGNAQGEQGQARAEDGNSHSNVDGQQ